VDISQKKTKANRYMRKMFSITNHERMQIKIMRYHNLSWDIMLEWLFRKRWKKTSGVEMEIRELLYTIGENVK
jgi:phage terminase large subunit GpA-like protein